MAQIADGAGGDDDTDPQNAGDKTVILRGESETLKVDKEKAKEANACLIVVRGTQQSKNFELSLPSMFIGRDVTAEISVADQNVSRKHAEVLVSNGVVKIRDNKSTNGTFVNDKKISGEVVLKKDDMVKVGGTILKFLPPGEIETYLYGALANKGNIDALTASFNKGYIMEALEAEVKRAKALHQDFTLIILDLDHFKKINDGHGHAAGDYVLKEASAMMKAKVLPKSSMFGRFGGEEFMVLLPTTGLEAGLAIAESMRSALENYNFTYDGKKLTVTASLGVAELAVDVENAQALFKLADKAVYDAKHGGRNRVCRG